ncbi:nucleoredoxin [Platysternon megacephalum]|uniref:Nucleoredoxin n=1 Tax=Platysternon megacephalum TaxID=55544 RepID=A0A4D9EYJ8_9SAUR|nr:nucleoredoxin [Platysternon megacephalum]
MSQMRDIWPPHISQSLGVRGSKSHPRRAGGPSARGAQAEGTAGDPNPSTRKSQTEVQSCWREAKCSLQQGQESGSARRVPFWTLPARARLHRWTRTSPPNPKRLNPRVSPALISQRFWTS